MSHSLRNFTAPLLCGVAACIAGCGDGAKQFPIAAVRGKVVCDGEHVRNVIVYFNPVSTSEKEQAVIGKQAIGVANDVGEFVLSTYNDQDGAVIGRHSVRVEAPRGDEADGFSCNCQLGDGLEQTQVDVKADTNNDFTIELLPKPKKAKPRALSPDEQEELDEI
jgi:hypothetical protein